MRTFLVFLCTLIADLRRLSRKRVSDVQLAMLMTKITPECKGFLAECGCESLRDWVDSLVACDKAAWTKFWIIVTPLCDAELDPEHVLLKTFRRLMLMEPVPQNSPEPTKGKFGPFAQKATGPAGPPIPGAGYW